jgi:hypothetical protein
VLGGARFNAYWFHAGPELVWGAQTELGLLVKVGGHVAF